MIRWLILAPISLIVSLICYLTNPLVVLFCNDDGELPSFLHLWQTVDNSCNPSDVTENHQLPDWLLYDWAAHYEEWKGTTPELSANGRTRWFTRCINDDFTVVELLQRYVCRVYWLTRNCANGWAFWAFGILPGVDWEIVEKTDTKKYLHEAMYFWWIDRAWCYKDESHWFSLWGYEIKKEFYIGYKVKEEAQVDTRAMIATRLTVRIKKEA